MRPATPRRIVPDELPEDGPAYDAMIDALKSNDIVKGKFLSDDGQLAMIIIALDREVVREKTARVVIGDINTTRRRAARRHGPDGEADRRAGDAARDPQRGRARPARSTTASACCSARVIAVIFFRRVSLMLVAALPPVLAVTWSLGLLGWMGFKLNLFLNVMTPLIMVMGFADSMQMVSAIRIRLREGDDRYQAVRFAVRIVGPACVLAHGVALLAFLRAAAVRIRVSSAPSAWRARSPCSSPSSPSSWCCRSSASCSSATRRRWPRTARRPMR